MQSRLRSARRSPTFCRWLGLLLLVLVVAAKPEDWVGSRDPGRYRSQWNTSPKDGWWQYRCPRCGEFYQCQDEPQFVVTCPSPKHPISVKMDLVNNPTTDKPA
jgi:hypothetical protein